MHLDDELDGLIARVDAEAFLELDYVAEDDDLVWAEARQDRILAMRPFTSVFC